MDTSLFWRADINQWAFPNSLELELNILEHTNSSISRMGLRLVIVSNDRRTIIKLD